RGESRDGVVLPGAGIAVAARPGVEPEAVALVAGHLALVAVAREQALRAPDVAPPAFHVVVHEGAFVAVTARPAFHALAVLLAQVEFAFVRRDPLRLALSLGLAVHAAALVRALQLRIGDHAARLGVRREPDGEQGDQRE